MPLDTPIMLEGSLGLTMAMDVSLATEPLATVDTMVVTLLDTSATLATVDTTTASVRLTLRPMPTPLARLLTVFPSITPMPLDTPTTLESSPVSITAMDVSLAMEPSAIVAFMVDIMEAMLDTLEPTTANFTLSSHHNFA